MFNKLLFFLLLSITITSCFSHCDSNKVGSEKLLNTSKLFNPYSGKSLTKFVSSKNETLHLKITTENTINRNCVNFVCSLTADPFKSPPCEYVEGEAIVSTFTNANKNATDNDWVLSLATSVDLYRSETKLFYDLLSVSLSTKDVIIQGVHPLEAHFTSPEYSKSTLSQINLLTSESAIVLNGHKYFDVLSASQNSNILYLKKQEGIIGFIVSGISYSKID
jgi:uncharacterized membrane protein YcgQ (UPF0703/DUF1980 family)